jgi:hypothetical protein
MRLVGILLDVRMLSVYLAPAIISSADIIIIIINYMIWICLHRTFQDS